MNKALLLWDKKSILIQSNIGIASCLCVEILVLICLANKLFIHFWRVGRVVDCGGLENR